MPGSRCATKDSPAIFTPATQFDPSDIVESPGAVVRYAGVELFAFVSKFNIYDRGLEGPCVLLGTNDPCPRIG